MWASKKKESDAVGAVTDEEFANRVDYRGGVFAALEYDLKAEDLKDKDGELYKAWLELEAKYEEMKPLCSRAQSALDAAWGTDY